MLFFYVHNILLMCIPCKYVFEIKLEPTFSELVKVWTSLLSGRWLKIFFQTAFHFKSQSIRRGSALLVISSYDCFSGLLHCFAELSFFSVCISDSLSFFGPDYFL